MDSTALNELIAEIRTTKTSLAEAEQKVPKFTAELAQQDHEAKVLANSAMRTQIHTKVHCGSWLAEA